MKKQYIIVLAVLLGLVILLFYFKDEKVYISEDYSPTGKLVGRSEYVIRNEETIFHGKFVNYNEKGIKISEGQFIDGEPIGKCNYYYDNGKIEALEYKRNSKVTLEFTYYNQSGLIRKYVMCNYIGEPKFIIEFDEKGVRQYDGYSTYSVEKYKIVEEKEYKIKSNDVLKVGDVIKYDYLLANIPNTKRTFKIENISVDDKKVKRTITKKAPTSIIVEEVLTKKGINRIRAITQYIFNDKVTPIKNDTIFFDVNVN